MGRILKSYFFWTYERGSFHYDVMVTMILAFIFITPFLWNYGDQPQPEKLAANSVLVKLDGPGKLCIRCSSGRCSTAGSPLDTQLQQRIQDVSGAVTLDSYEAVKEPGGRIVAIGYARTVEALWRILPSVVRQEQLSHL